MYLLAPLFRLGRHAFDGDHLRPGRRGLRRAFGDEQPEALKESTTEQAILM